MRYVRRKFAKNVLGQTPYYRDAVEISDRCGDDYEDFGVS